MLIGSVTPPLSSTHSLFPLLFSHLSNKNLPEIVKVDDDNVAEVMLK